MPEIVSISVEPSSLTVTAGETTQATVSLLNTGQTVDQFTITIEGLHPGWYSLPVSSVALFPNDRDTLKIILTPPKAEAKGGLYQFQIIVSSQDNPNAPVILKSSVQIIALPEVGLELVPAVMSGRKAHYHLVITNPGTGETRLDLKSTTGERWLKLTPDSTSVAVPAGNRFEAEIDARLHWLTWFFGKKESAFRVAVTLPGGAEARTVTGTVLRLPWYRALGLHNIRLPWIARPPQIQDFKVITDDNREFRISWSVKRGTLIKFDEDNVQKQGQVAVRPQEARAYVLKAENRYGTVSRKIEVQPITVPPARTCERIKVSLPQGQIKANAGGVPMPIIVQMQNTGQIVDKFSVDVLGVDQSWFSRSASSIALMPQATGQTQILFQPPKQKPVRNGVYPFAISVQSQVTPSDATIVLGEIEVLPLVDFKATVHPYRVNAHFKANIFLNLTNTGVTDINFALQAVDLEEGLRFKFKDENPTLPAWTSIEMPLRIKPKRGSFIGEKKRYDVTVTARGPEGKSQSANCEMHHTPLFASWRPILRVIRIIIAVAILVIVVVLLLNMGGGFSQLTNSPATWVDNFVGTITGWFNR